MSNWNQYMLEETPATVTWFTVVGRGEFPLDMLRYDQAWPVADGSFASHTGRRFVRMGCVQRGGPTIARWASFGWTVVDPAGGLADEYPSHGEDRHDGEGR